MAPLKPQDPLETLQQMLTEVLVHTGKALRASRRDEHGNTSQTHGSIQSKMPDTIRTFHSALDEIDNEIIRAKSVLLRDLSALQAQRNPPVTVPQPIESQSKSPMVIDIESSSPADTGNQPLPGAEAEAEADAPKQMAPFPDMGLDPMDSAPSAAPVKEEGLDDIKMEANAAPPAAMAPMPLMEEPSMSEAPKDLPPETTPDQPDSRLNFTDMAFSLAPNNDGQEQQGAKEREPNFDLTTFAPPEGAENMLPDNLLPSGTTADAAAPFLNTQDNSVTNLGGVVPKDEPVGDAVDDFDFGPDINDGTDFDFSLENDSFNDLMNTRDMMEHGSYDAEFFGLDKEEN